MQTVAFLEKICFQIHIIQKRSQAERSRSLFGRQFSPEVLVMQKEEISLELRRENATYQEPHLHITHSDKINLSLSLQNFSILAGRIDPKTYKQLLNILTPKHEQLKAIWLAVDENEDSIGATKVIESI